MHSHKQNVHTIWLHYTQQFTLQTYKSDYWKVALRSYLNVCPLFFSVDEFLMLKWIIIIILSAVYNECGLTFVYSKWNTYNTFVLCVLQSWLIPHLTVTLTKFYIHGMCVSIFHLSVDLSDCQQAALSRQADCWLRILILQTWTIMMELACLLKNWNPPSKGTSWQFWRQ